MMTPKRSRRIGPRLLVIIGITVMLIGLGLHWWKPTEHEIEWIPQLVGACIAFAGFYGMDPKGALQGGGFIANAGTTVLGIVRGQGVGRRATDAVVVEQPAQPALDEQDIPPRAG